MKEKLKAFMPHIIAVVVFIGINLVYFSPQLKGYSLRQGDIEQYLGMSKEIKDHREKFDEEPLWTNGAFGGMPAYQISVKSWSIVNSIRVAFLTVMPRPMGYVFILMLGFYILLMCFKVEPPLAIIGAVAFGLASLNILYLSAGHNGKIHAISFLPPIIGGLILVYRGKLWKGAALVTLFTCFHLLANHLQMTYYVLFLLVAVAGYEGFRHFKAKTIPMFVKASGVVAVAGLLGVMPAISSVLLTAEYGPHSTRGKTELAFEASGDSDKTDALDRSYIKQYSLSKGEVWSMFVPNIKGGRMGRLGSNEDAMKAVSPALRQQIGQQASYWGEQYSSGGAFYFGAIMFLLFVLGMVFVKDNIKWVFFGVSMLAVMLSWKYGALVDFFIDNVPMFSKFRDTKMMLILVMISVPCVGMLFLKELKDGVDKKKLLIAIGSVVGLFAVFYAAPTGLFDFSNKQEIAQFANLKSQYASQPQALDQISQMEDEVVAARVVIFRADVLRTILYILGAGLLIYLFAIQKLKQVVFASVLGVLVLVDLWSVDKRYLTNEKNGKDYMQWVSNDKYKNPYRASAADNAILNLEMAANPTLAGVVQSEVASVERDGAKSGEFEAMKEQRAFRELNFGTNYRVVELGNPFNGSKTSFFHKAIGGYHGAKLRRYQELISHYIGAELGQIQSTLGSQPTQGSIEEMYATKMNVLSMLNTKYVIYNPQAQPLINTNAYGNAWFVGKLIYAATADEEMAGLKQVSRTTGVISADHQSAVSAGVLDGSTIKLSSYKPNELVYDLNMNSPQFAVFSEIYYEEGWNAYVDGELTDYYKVNYTLRGLPIPAGAKQVVFKFEPATASMASMLSTVGSLLVVVFIGFALYMDKKEGLVVETEEV